MFQQADFLRIPLLDGSFGLAQVAERIGSDTDADMLLLTSSRRIAADADATPLAPTDVTALVRVVTRDMGDHDWTIAGFDQIPRFGASISNDWDAHRDTGYADLTPHDPAIIEAFMSAWHGLYPRDAFGALFDEIKLPHLPWPKG